MSLSLSLWLYFSLLVLVWLLLLLSLLLLVWLFLLLSLLLLTWLLLSLPLLGLVWLFFPRSICCDCFCQCHSWHEWVFSCSHCRFCCVTVTIAVIVTFWVANFRFSVSEKRCDMIVGAIETEKWKNQGRSESDATRSSLRMFSLCRSYRAV